MSTHPPRLTRAEQRERTRERLLDAAAEAFAEHGFDGASIDDITGRAGFTRGAFYSNFTDKADLLVTLCERHIDRFATSELPTILAVPEEERLSALAGWLAEGSPPLETLLILELARHRNHSPEVAAVLDRVVATVLAGVERLLAVEGSELADLPEGERERRARAALAAVVGLDVLAHLGVETEASMIEVLFAGIATPIARPGGSS